METIPPKTIFRPGSAWRLWVFLLALTLCSAGPALAAEGQEEPGVWVPSGQILAGEKTKISGFRFHPGQEVTLLLDGSRLNAQPFVVDDDGGFKGKITIPGDTDVGLLHITAKADGDEVAEFDLMVSTVVPLSGADRFSVTQNKLPAGLYQAAQGADGKAIFATRSVFKQAPESGLAQAGILKIDAQTLEVLDSTTPPASPARSDDKDSPFPPPVHAAFGMAADSANQTIWVTNSLNNTVAVYRQHDLSLLKQFKAGTVAHPHSVVVDTQHGKAYVSAVGENHVAVIDTQTLQHLKNIEITINGDKKFVPVGLALDGASGTLYVSSMDTPAIAVIDTNTDALEKVIPLEQARGIRGLAWDADNKLLLAASYGNDSLLVVNPETGELVHDVYVGARPLAVAWDAVSGLAFVANRGAGTVAVVDPESGELVANLAIGSLPNHVIADGVGNIYVVNKSNGPDDPKGDLITRITPKANPET